MIEVLLNIIMDSTSLTTVKINENYIKQNIQAQAQGQTQEQTQAQAQEQTQVQAQVQAQVQTQAQEQTRTAKLRQLKQLRAQRQTHKQMTQNQCYI